MCDRASSKNLASATSSRRDGGESVRRSNSYSSAIARRNCVVFPARLSSHYACAACRPAYASATSATAQHSFPRIPEFVYFLDAFGLKRCVAHRQDFVDEQNLGIPVDRHGKRQPHHHAC